MLGDSVSMSEALMVTVVCMFLVFLTLMLLSGVLELFKYVFKPKEEVKKVINQSNTTTSERTEENIVLENLDGDDAVAAIAAIVAASAEKRNSRIHIKSIKRVR